MACSTRCVVISVVVLAVLAAAGFGIYWEFFHNKSTSSNSDDPGSDSTLKFLVVVTRHGNRPPLYPLGNTASNSSDWPFGNDGLSKVGRQQLYKMGVKLRSLYNGFLNTEYFPDDVYVSSTTIERVVQSGQLLLAGLYPATGAQAWNQTLLWNPIPVNQDSLDNTQDATTQCTRFTTVQTEIKEAFATKWANNITYFGEYATSELNTTVSGTFGMIELWDTLLCEDIEGYTLPDWASGIYPDAMYPMMNDMYVQYVTGTDELTSLLIGPFFVEMMSVIESKINGTLSPDRKLYFWSGHDDTLITLQAVIGLSSENITGVVFPGSAIVFEIHQDAKTENYYIKISYIDGHDDNNLTPQAIDIPNCGSPCLFDVFKTNSAKFTNITSSNYDSACNS